MEMANACIQDTFAGNNIALYDPTGAKIGGSTGISINNNSGPAPSHCGVHGGEVCGAGSFGIQVQAADHTKLHGVTVRDCGDTLIIDQGGSYLEIANCTLEGPCQSHIYLDGTTTNLTDIDIVYNVFRGAASFDNIWGYNASGSNTLTNLRIANNNAMNATWGNLSLALDWDTSEQHNVQVLDNYYDGTGSTANFAPYNSGGAMPSPFSAAIQQFSIPVAAKIAVTVPVCAGDQWLKVFSMPYYGAPILMGMHVYSSFLVSDNRQQDITAYVIASPYGQNAQLLKFPDAYYNGSPLKEIVYNNPSSGSAHEVWLHFGPNTGGGTVTVTGADWAAYWINAPAAVTTEPTWATNHCKLDTSVDSTALKVAMLSTSGAAKIAGAFGCNGATPQAAVASGGAVGSVTGTATANGYGFATAAEFNSAITAINAIKTLANTARSTLVANGQQT
jgi:hypothetical protein